MNADPAVPFAAPATVPGGAATGAGVGRRSLALATIAYGLLVFALLPPEVIPIGPDEAGYLKSALETIQRHRPWTDDFLEPWAASLSSLAAGVYFLTGKISLAIHGSITGLAMASFAGLCAVLRLRLNRARDVLICAFLILTFPPLLRRLVEFIDLIVYLPCFFWCIWAAEKKRWWLFLALWCVALADRQSAALWAILPLAEALRHRQKTPALVLALGTGWFLLVAATMNVTDTQLARTGRMLADLARTPVMQAALVSLVLGAIGAGLGAFVRPAHHTPGRALRWLAPAVALGVLFYDPRRLVATDTAYDFLYGGPGRVYASLAIVAAAWGWLARQPRVRGEFALWALASVGLITLRQIVFDRYAFELVLVAFFAVLLVAPQPAETTAPAPPLERGWRQTRLALVVLALLFHLPFYLLTKVAIDETRAWTLLHENALRRGQLRTSEITTAPFPFRSWHLHAHAKAHPAPGQRRLAGYARFSETTLAPWRRYPETLARLRRLPAEAIARDAPTPLAGGTFRLAWFWSAEFGLVRTAPAAAVDPLGPGYKRVTLPLDDEEWRALLRGPLID